MKTLFGLLLAAGAIIGSSSASYACSCATGDPAFEFNEAKVVFIGRMIKGTERFSVKDNDGKSVSLEAGTIRFAVQESFKGEVVGEVSLEVASMRGTSCGPYGLRRGIVYLVYGYASKQDPQTLYTGVCTRTIEAASEYAKEDLKFLRNMPPPGTGGNLRGRVWADLRAGGATPLTNVTVTVVGPDQQELKAFTNDKGDFEIKFLKPGKYVITPTLPEHYYSDHPSREITIEDRGTAAVGFEAYMDGSVVGRVVDKEGNPFNSVFLHFGNKAATYGHSTGEDGEFKVEGVPPGDYYLYLELENSDYKKNKYYYYPGTLNREEAKVFEVGLGEKIEGVVFTLPEGFNIRLVEGQVTWKDGRPAANVDIMLLCPENSRPDGFRVEFGPTSGKTDENGNFKLEAFTGETYWIEARASGENVEFHSRSRQIQVTDHVRDLRVVLSEKGYFGEGCPDKK